MSANSIHDYVDEKKGQDIDHVESSEATDQTLMEAAVLRGEEETKLGFKGVVKLHYPAALWSMALS